MNSDLTAQIHQYLASAPGSLFAQQEIEMLDHWQGDANLLWRVRVTRKEVDQDAVVKLFLDAGQARSRRQFDGHQHFAPLGLAPPPLWADRYPHGLSRQLIVYRWVEGENITPEEPSSLIAWAEAIGTLHTSGPELVRRFSPHPLDLDYYWRIEQASFAQVNQWLATSGLALQAYVEQLSAACENLVQTSLSRLPRTGPTPVHGDLSAAHTLLERGRIQLLDWEMFGLGDPALDVARLFQHEAQSLTVEQVDLWLEHYQQSVDQPGIVARIDTYRRLLEAHNVVYLLVGLQQHTANRLDVELVDALPFMQTALTAAIERAATAYDLSDNYDAARIASEFFAWLA